MLLLNDCYCVVLNFWGNSDSNISHKALKPYKSTYFICLKNTNFTVTIIGKKTEVD